MDLRVNKRRTKRCLICGKVNENIPLFLFPSNANRRRIWLEFCNVGDVVEKKYFLCLKHFENDCISKRKNRFDEGTTTRIRLKKNANPSLHPTFTRPTKILDSTEYNRIQSESKRKRKCLLCKKNTRDEVPLFKFPANKVIARQWMLYCKINENENINQNWRLCGVHFSDEVLVQSHKTGRRNVLPHAVPSVRSTMRIEEEATEATGMHIEEDSTEATSEIHLSTREEQCVATSENPNPSCNSVHISLYSPPTILAASTSGRYATPTTTNGLRFRSCATGIPAPRRRNKYLAATKSKAEKNDTEMKHLQVENYRLPSRLAALKDLLKPLVDKKLLSQSNFDQLLRKIT